MDAWSSAQPATSTRTAEFMASVYRWMAFGLALIGIILASIVNLFLRSNAAEFVISCCGVLVFAGLTAYDTQKLRAIGEEGGEKHALVGALALYLDFINLFLFLLRFMGRRRN